MFEKILKLLPVGFMAVLITAGIFGCDSGLETSPEPGILRVSIQSNPQDTAIVIKSDTFSVIQGDSFGVKFFQGKVYNGDNYALLYESTDSYLTEDLVFNVIKRVDHSYKKLTVYESYVPPKSYDRVQVGINAEEIRVSRVYTRFLYDADGNVIGSRLDTTTIVNPVRLPNDASPLMNFEKEFEVQENKTTEIVLRLDPFDSLERFKDSYVFNRKISVQDVIYHD
ncbi:MAG: hypothetical protein GF313_16050 [Caldithrix sp.]|nr:hypothetical protein [Caldithrix sp.]